MSLAEYDDASYAVDSEVENNNVGKESLKCKAEVILDQCFDSAKSGFRFTRHVKK